MARRLISRHMVRSLGQAHGVSFSEADVAVLTDELGRPPLPSTSKHLAVMWMIGRRFGRRWAARVAGVLAARQALRVAGDLGCRGYLLDAALHEHLVVPLGPASADQVREAIDRVCEEVGTDPVRRGFEMARRAVHNLGQPPSEVAPTPAEVAPHLKARLRSALADIRRARSSNGSGQHAPMVTAPAAEGDSATPLTFWVP